MDKYHKQDVAPIEKENERDESYNADNPQIDAERTNENYHCRLPDGTYTEIINARLKELNITPRKDAVVMNSFVVGSDKEFFDKLFKVQRYAFFDDCAKFFAERYGEENIISAVVHLDETTPHMHLNLIPITPDGRLCSKDLFDKTKLRQLQTDFYETVGKKYGLERGIEGSQAKHLSTAEYKAKKIIEQAEVLRQEKQVYADALTQAKNGEIPRRRGKLQEQVIALTAENKDLTKRLDKAMGETLEYAKKAESAQKDKDKDEKYIRVGKYVARNAPNLCRNILCGVNAANMLFSAFEDFCSPSVTRGLPLLQKIEQEMQEQKEEYEHKNAKNNTYKY